MKITLLNTGKTEDGYIQEGISLYEKRIRHYCNFESTFVNIRNDGAKSNANLIRQQEAEKLLKKINDSGYMVLLDEKGKQLRSAELATWLNEHGIRGTRHLVFVTGGAYGFHETVYKRADESISLSKLTFPHQLVRLIFLEQLYRAFTIIRNEPYHNE